MPGDDARYAGRHSTPPGGPATSWNTATRRASPSGIHSLALWVDGESTAMNAQYGSPEQGIYGATLSADECAPWAVTWETRAGESGVFPATGAFLAGGCDTEYDASVIVAVTDDEGPGDGSTNSGVFEVDNLEVVCGTVPGTSVAGVVAGLLLARRRRATGSRGGS